MSIEEKLDALMKAIEANTAAVNRSTEARVEALGVAKTLTAEKPAAEKPAADKKETKATEKPAAEKPAGDEAYAGLKEIIADYLGVDRKEERAARQEKVKALLNHEKIKKPGVAADAKPDVTNIAVEAVDLFKKQMGLLKEKGDLTTPEKAEEDSLV